MPPSKTTTTPSSSGNVIKIRALNRQKEHVALVKPQNALQFHKNELMHTASGRVFTLSILPVTTAPWLTIEVVDGHKKKNHVEVFDRFASKNQCSCEEFTHDRSNYCVHIAAIDNVKNNRPIFAKQDKGVEAWVKTYANRISQMPFSMNSYRSPSFSFYDAASKTITVYGASPGDTPGVASHASVAVKTCRKLFSQGKLLKHELSPQVLDPSKMPDDAGLLREVTLYDYQKTIFQKMVMAKRAICSMTMGAGKTITTICCYAWIQKHEKPDARLVVVCPKSLRLQWASEIKRVLGQTSVQVMKAEDLKKPGHIFIATYQYFTRHVEEFVKAGPYDCAIVDEIQFVKNADTKTWQAISELKTDYFYGLSGTVIENRLDDLYSIMEIIHPGLLGPKWKFDETFQNLLLISKSKILYKGTRNIPILQKELKNHVFSYDNLQLPNIDHIFVDTVLTKPEKAQHDLYMEKAKELIAKSLNGTPAAFHRLMIQAYLLKARQACNGEELLTKTPSTVPSAKVSKFLETVDAVCVQGGEKLVVFSEWTEMLDICKRFMPSGVGHVSYTGKESSKQRALAVTKFQTDASCQVFFSSDAGGVGLDGLQLVANNVLHLELPWNPSRLDQRTGRVYRLLQKKDCKVFYIVSNGGIEQQIKNLLTEKRLVREITLKDLSI